MNEIFFHSFSTVFYAMLKIALISVFAGILVHKELVSQIQINALASMLVKIFLPALIFSNILSTFQPDTLPYWWLLPLSGVVMVTLGLGITFLFFFRELPEKRNLLPLASMQNAGYLVLPLGRVIYADQFDLFAMYCFLYILGYSPLLWSIGKYLSTNQVGQHNLGYSWSKILPPPVWANLLAMFFVLTNTRQWIPTPLFESIDLLGKAAIPVATFVLGATLGSISLKTWPSFWDTIRVLLVKFVLIPAITFLFLREVHLKESYPLLSELLIIQSASAPATAIILQVRGYGGDLQKVGSTMFISYSVTLLSIPFWLALWS